MAGKGAIIRSLPKIGKWVAKQGKRLFKGAKSLGKKGASTAGKAGRKSSKWKRFSKGVFKTAGTLASLGWDFAKYFSKNQASNTQDQDSSSQDLLNDSSNSSQDNNESARKKSNTELQLRIQDTKQEIQQLEGKISKNKKRFEDNRKIVLKLQAEKSKILDRKNDRRTSERELLLLQERLDEINTEIQEIDEEDKSLTRDLIPYSSTSEYLQNRLDSLDQQKSEIDQYNDRVDNDELDDDSSSDYGRSSNGVATAKLSKTLGAVAAGLIFLPIAIRGVKKLFNDKISDLWDKTSKAFTITNQNIEVSSEPTDEEDEEDTSSEDSSSTPPKFLSEEDKKNNIVNGAYLDAKLGIKRDKTGKALPIEAGIGSALFKDTGAEKQDIVKGTAISTGVTLATGTVSKLAGKTAVKEGAKIAGKAVGKSLAKKIPVLGALVGLGLGISRAANGDWTGAGLEILSGLASTVPGVGTGISVALDLALAAKDYNELLSSEKQLEEIFGSMDESQVQMLKNNIQKYQAAATRYKKTVDKQGNVKYEKYIDNELLRLNFEADKIKANSEKSKSLAQLKLNNDILSDNRINFESVNSEITKEIFSGNTEMEVDRRSKIKNYYLNFLGILQILSRIEQTIPNKESVLTWNNDNFKSKFSSLPFSNYLIENGLSLNNQDYWGLIRSYFFQTASLLSSIYPGLGDPVNALGYVICGKRKRSYYEGVITLTNKNLMGLSDNLLRDIKREIAIKIDITSNVDDKLNQVSVLGRNDSSDFVRELDKINSARMNAMTDISQSYFENPLISGKVSDSQFTNYGSANKPVGDYKQVGGFGDTITYADSKTAYYKTNPKEREKEKDLTDAQIKEILSSFSAVYGANNIDPGITSPSGYETGTSPYMQLRYDRSKGTYRRHYGIDIRSHAGNIVRSATDGKVVKVQTVPGNPDRTYVTVQDKNGLYWDYIHTYPGVTANTDVVKGQPIGVTTNYKSGSHLHLQVRAANSPDNMQSGAKFIDPGLAGASGMFFTKGGSITASDVNKVIATATESKVSTSSDNSESLSGDSGVNYKAIESAFSTSSATPKSGTNTPWSKSEAGGPTFDDPTENRLKIVEAKLDAIIQLQSKNIELTAKVGMTPKVVTQKVPVRSIEPDVNKTHLENMS